MWTPIQLKACIFPTCEMFSVDRPISAVPLEGSRSRCCTIWGATRSPSPGATSDTGSLGLRRLPPPVKASASAIRLAGTPSYNQNCTETA